MTDAAPLSDPERWLHEIFSAQAVRRGGVVRRSTAWVEREIGTEALVAEVRRRGFHMLEAGGQYLIICNPGAIRVVC